MPGKLYPKSCWEIMSDWLRTTLGRDGTISRAEMLQYMSVNWPKFKRTTVDCHIRMLTTNDSTRVYYNAGSDDDVLFREPSGQYRLYRPGEDPAPVYEKPLKPAATEEDGATQDEGEFAYETDLRDFLARHLDLIEPKLKLFEEEGVSGVEFSVDGRSIDILALDATGRYVIIELKVSRGHERVVGQLAYYMAWVQKNLAEGQPVRGVIVAREVSDELKMATSLLPDVEIYRYELKVTLAKA